MIIVTKRCLIKATHIHHITVEEEINRDAFKDGYSHAKSKRDLKDTVEALLDSKPNCYNIVIRYVPSVTTGNTRDDTKECKIVTYDKEVAEGLFAEIVKQYREQNPDELYLNKIADNFLGG